MSVIKLQTVNLDSAEVSSVELGNISRDGLDSYDSIAYVVNWQLSRRRSGSAKIKQMSEISGSTAKPFRQKGTGNARQGSKRSVQMRGGRTCFGPIPRSFDYSLPKKIVKLALVNIIKTKILKGN